METIKETPTEIEVLQAQLEIAEAKIISLKAMIAEDPVTQEILVTKSSALDTTRSDLESRKAVIGAMPLSEYEKQVLRADYQRQIELTNTQKETLQSYIVKEMK